MRSQPLTNPSDISSANPVPVNQPSVSPQIKPSLMAPILGTLLISGFVFGFGGYYLGSQKNPSLNQNIQTFYSPAPTALPSVSPTSTETSKPSEIGNAEMKSATKAVSSDGTSQVWLDGKNFTATQLWIGNVDGSQKKLLVTGTDSTQNAVEGSYSLVSPIFSPTNMQVAYLRAVLNKPSGTDITDHLDLYIVDKDGTNDHLVKSNVSTARGQYGKTDLNWTSEGITYTDYSNSATGVKTTVQPK